MEYMYAWGDPVENFLLGEVGDHTWVTTYEPGTGSPNVKNGDYWYCRGNARTQAQKIVRGNGGVAFARQIAKPNDPSENVGIRYILDGVCHQMANRLLRFSFDDNGDPVKVGTVNGFPKGYQLSKPMYGEYGGERSVFPFGPTDCFVEWNLKVAAYQKELLGESNE